MSESLILPVILALLPMSSLFLANESPMGPNQCFVAGRGGAAEGYMSRGRMTGINSPSEELPIDSIHVVAELDNTSTKAKDLGSKGQQQGQIERELQAIDRM